MIRKMVLPGVTIVVVSPPADARPFLDDGGAPGPLGPRRDRTLRLRQRVLGRGRQAPSCAPLLSRPADIDGGGRCAKTRPYMRRSPCSGTTFRTSLSGRSVREGLPRMGKWGSRAVLTNTRRLVRWIAARQPPPRRRIGRVSSGDCIEADKLLLQLGGIPSPGDDPGGAGACVDEPTRSALRPLSDRGNDAARHRRMAVEAAKVGCEWAR